MSTNIKLSDKFFDGEIKTIKVYNRVPAANSTFYAQTVIILVPME